MAERRIEEVPTMELGGRSESFWGGDGVDEEEEAMFCFLREGSEGSGVLSI